MKVKSTRSNKQREVLLREYFLNAYLLGTLKQFGSNRKISKAERRAKLDRLDGDFLPSH